MAHKILSTLALTAGMFIGSTAWALTVELTAKTPVDVSTCGEITEVPFAYLAPLEQTLVKLSVDSYNAGRAAAKICNYKEHNGTSIFICEYDGTLCYAGWVPTEKKPEFKIGCGDANSDPVQCEIQEFECCDKEIGSNIYQGCSLMPGGGTCGGIWVPCAERWADCG